MRQPDEDMVASQQKKRIERAMFAPGHRRDEREERIFYWWTLDLQRFARLERYVCEMMAIPQMRCRKRSCRRRGRCSFMRVDDRSPWCLANLKTAEHAAYVELLGGALHQCMPHTRIAVTRQTEFGHACEELEFAMTPYLDIIRRLRQRWRDAAEAVIGRQA